MQFISILSPIHRSSDNTGLISRLNPFQINLGKMVRKLNENQHQFIRILCSHFEKLPVQILHICRIHHSFPLNAFVFIYQVCVNYQDSDGYPSRIGGCKTTVCFSLTFYRYCQKYSEQQKSYSFRLICFSQTHKQLTICTNEMAM